MKYDVLASQGTVRQVRSVSEMPSQDFLQHLNQLEELPRLSEKRASFLLPNSFYGFTPLHRAALDGDLSGIGTGTPSAIDSLSFSGATPLALALLFDRQEVAMALLRFGANPFIIELGGLVPAKVCEQRLPESRALLERILPPKPQTRSDPVRLQLYRQHKSIGEQVLQYVQGFHVRSLNRSIDLQGVTKAEYLDRTEQILYLRQGFMRDRSAALPIRAGYLLAHGQNLQKIYTLLADNNRVPVGNCSELAELGLAYIASLSPRPRVELACLNPHTGVKVVSAAFGASSSAQVVRPDHVFLVIGREYATDSKNPLAWGFETVICDPWAKRVYSADKVREEMMLIRSVTADSIDTKVLVSIGSESVIEDHGAK